MVILGVIGYFIPVILPYLYQILGLQSLALLMLILLAIAIQTKYLADVLGKPLSRAVELLQSIAERMGVRVGEELGSPSVVYAECRWLRYSKVEVVDGVHHVYVYCAHPRRPLTTDGCPSPCPHFDPSEQPTGAGAFGGMVLGGLAGLVFLGGPLGVIVGGVLGALAGNAIEVAKPVKAKIEEYEREGIRYRLHVDERMVGPPLNSSFALGKFSLLRKFRTDGPSAHAIVAPCRSRGAEGAKVK